VTPPRLPRWLLRLAAPPEDRAAIVGAFDEEFHQRADSGRAAAAWYWRHATLSIASVLRLRWRRSAPLADLGGDVRYALRTIRSSSQGTGRDSTTKRAAGVRIFCG